jgi:glycerol-3-phosphate dehydrogenase (NAD(P)+)
MSTPVAVLGAGSWGTALAVQLARNGVPTTLWGRTPQAVVEMATTRRNARYLPELELPGSLQLSAMLEPTARDAGTLLLAVPSHAFDELLHAIAPWVGPGVGIAWATKGFDPGSGRFLHELVAEHLPGHAAAVVTGPSFAREVALGLPTALTVHSSDAAFAQVVAQQLHSPRFRA